MNNKLWRKSRDLVHLFELEYPEDPEGAISNLYERLEDERAIVERWTITALQRRHPEAGLYHG